MTCHLVKLIILVAKTFVLAIDAPFVCVEKNWIVIPCIPLIFLMKLENLCHN